MFVVMFIIFVVVKCYCDIKLGGVIKFWFVFGLGVGIVFLVLFFYVFVWEIYFNFIGGVWVEVYVE